jgi:predicted NAD-dependent protein-ADP-ribosyltransferase YbiA (DUF1768 family)
MIGSEGWADELVVTEEDKQDALAWLAEWRRAAEPAEQAGWRDPERPPGQRHVVRFASGTRVVGVDPANEWLSPASPHPVTDHAGEWPTVLHAYCAASVSGPELIAAVRTCSTARQALELVRDAPRRDRWPQIRIGEMTRLLRLKFSQHPDLADRLLATGDSILQAASITGSDFWDSQGQNWIGRLLELVRAELASAAAARPTGSTPDPDP